MTRVIEQTTTCSWLDHRWALTVGSTGCGRGQSSARSGAAGEDARIPRFGPAQAPPGSPLTSEKNSIKILMKSAGRKTRVRTRWSPKAKAKSPTHYWAVGPAGRSKPRAPRARPSSLRPAPRPHLRAGPRLGPAHARRWPAHLGLGCNPCPQVACRA